MSTKRPNPIILILLLFLITGALEAQDTTINNIFNPRSPISHPLRLSGSFGELRNNHFHAGIDIKSSNWNTSGDPIYSVEDGFVSRIYVSGTGYGNALYIDHPGGFTTVYGHLDKFRDDIASYVKTLQYGDQDFVVNNYPDSTRFLVKKGDIIGYMGNSGRSSAAHLHFEIRHTKSEKPINPYHFNMGPKDSRHPTILNLNISHLLPDTTIVDIDRFKADYIKSGTYKLQEDTIVVNAWRVGIEVNGFDRMDEASNKNGIYSIRMLVNGEMAYQYRLDSFSFDESKHINAHINYMDFHEMKRRYQRCYILPGDPLSIYSRQQDLNAIIPLFKDKKQHIQIIASDFIGNESVLEFWIKRNAEMKPAPPMIYNYVLEEGNAHLIKKEDFILYFPDSALYQNAYLHITQSDSVEAPLVSKHLFVNNGNIFKNKVDIFITPVDIPDSLLNKACIVSCGEKNFTSYGGELFENFITTKIYGFGDYAILLDTIPPRITPVMFSNGANSSKIVFKITDDLATAGSAEELSFKGFIDGQWALFEYDAKSSTITHFFEKTLESGEHTLKIILVDDRKNQTIFEQKFIKK